MGTMQKHLQNKKIIRTDIDSENGQDKCPNCGATDISLNTNTSKKK